MMVVGMANMGEKFFPEKVVFWRLMINILWMFYDMCINVHNKDLRCIWKEGGNKCLMYW